MHRLRFFRNCQKILLAAKPGPADGKRRCHRDGVKEEYDLGIVRYQSAFDKYFNTLFDEKKLKHEVLNEFSYVMVVSKNIICG